MKGWTTPAGVTWSSRSCATSEKVSENVRARSSGEYRETGKPEQCVGPSLAKVAITTAPPDRNAPAANTDVASAFVRFSEEVEDGTIVQYVVVPVRFPGEHIVMHEVHPECVVSRVSFVRARARAQRCRAR